MAVNDAIARARALREKSREVTHHARNARLISQIMRRRIKGALQELKEALEQEGAKNFGR